MLPIGRNSHILTLVAINPRKKEKWVTAVRRRAKRLPQRSRSDEQAEAKKGFCRLKAKSK
jgi:hypothetical protein